VVSTGDVVDDAGRTTTIASMHAIKLGIVGGTNELRGGRAFLRDVGRLPQNTCNLPPFPPSTPPADLRWSVAELIEAGQHMPPGSWRGPYLQVPRAVFGEIINAATVGPSLLATWTPYGAALDWAMLDGWGRPIVLQIPDFDPALADSVEERRYARLVSAGRDGLLETPRTAATVALAQYPNASNALAPGNLCGDDLVLYLHVADLRR
jgi:hypothetical protein